MSNQNLSFKKLSSSIPEAPINPEPFKGFLLAAYKSIADNVRSIKITRAIIIFYLLILVFMPPVLIMGAFFILPTQTAGFFNFQAPTQTTNPENSNSKVLAASTNTSQGSVLGEYVAAVLEPQAAATVKVLRIINPNTVSGVVLPEETNTLTQPLQTNTLVSGPVSIENIPGPQGPAGDIGVKGDTGLTGPAGSNGVGDSGATGPIGPQGETGITGVSGMTGIQGETGVTGQTGIAGITGQNGITGQTGLSGITGTTGPQGLTGITGVTGLSGVQGITGISGVTGSTGPQGGTGGAGGTGIQGTQGVTGILGITGLTGIKGNTGVTGTTGPQGLTGITGVTGTTGVQGIMGFTGQTGIQGLTGVSGSIGSTGSAGGQGITGVTGIAGTTGLTGLIGTTGVTGPQGTTGTTGVTGMTGVLGVTGITGQTGLQGVAGISGLTGNTGSQGITGITGIIGVQGNLGITGNTGLQGLTGLFGITGATGSLGSLTTGVGLTGSIIGGNLTLSLNQNQTFTTINGLVLGANTNGFSISGGSASSKTLTINNTITFGGTDSTSFTLPSSSDTLVGLTTSGTLTNKTIAASLNTISGLTNSNLSGSAGITNANLAFSSFSLSGNSGSGSISLGGTLSLAGAGITSVTASGSTFTVTATEADTLQSVYNRGNTISTTSGKNIAFTLPSGLATATSLTVTNNGSADSLIIDSSNTTTAGGTVNGLKINAPTYIPSTGSFNSVFLNTSTGAIANTYDQATIAVGNKASTDQQNFSTLNFTNGGTGYLDIEVKNGFINFQNTNALYDDFTDRVLNTTNRWTATATGSGSSCSLLAGGLNGLLRMTAGGSANRRCELSTQSTLSNGYYQRGNNPIFETKLKINVTTNVRIFAGFTNTAPTAGSDTNANTHHAYIEKLATGTNFQCVTDDGGGTEKVTDTGVTVNTGTYYRLRVEVRNGTTPETICTVDNGTTVTKTVLTANQPGLTNPMDIYLKVETANTTGKNMDVDYVRAWQDDSLDSALTIDNTETSTTIPSLTPEIISEATDSAIPTDNPNIDITDSNKLLRKIFDSLTLWLSDKSNGIKDFVSNKIHTQTICLSDEKNETCLTKSQLDQLLLKTGIDMTVTPVPSLISLPTTTLNNNQVSTVSAIVIPSISSDLTPTLSINSIEESSTISATGSY